MGFEVFGDDGAGRAAAGSDEVGWGPQRAILGASAHVGSPLAKRAARNAVQTVDQQRDVRRIDQQVAVIVRTGALDQVGFEVLADCGEDARPAVRCVYLRLGAR